MSFFPRPSVHPSVFPSVWLQTFHIFISFSGTTRPISTKLGTKRPRVKEINFLTTPSFHEGRWWWNSENTLTKLKVFFSRTTGPISTKLQRKSSVGKENLSCLNEWSRPFPKGGNNKIAIILWRNSKIFSRITGSLSTKLGEGNSGFYK